MTYQGSFRRAGSAPRWFRLAAVGSVLLFSAWATKALAQSQVGDADVRLVYVNKIQLFQQTSPTTPTPAPNPFTIKLGADGVPTRPNAISSGIFQKPGSSALLNLNSDGAGNVFFEGGRFATLAELNAAFPNGRYDFNLQTATTPFGYSAFVTINNDSYPGTTPRITSGTWATGGLQIDPAQSFTFTWPAFSTTFPDANITFQIRDDAGALVLNLILPANTTSTVLQANVLAPGQYYTASLSFNNRQFQFRDTFTTWASTYARQTDFKIATIGAVPALSGPSSPLGTVGQFFVYQVIASNHPFSYSSSALPPGLNFNSTLGIIHGVPTTPGTTTVQLTAQNIDGISPPKTLTPTIQAAPSSGPIIVSSTSALGYSDRPFKFQVVARPATPAARVTAAGLPSGLTLDPVTGIISGTTKSVGSFSVNLTVDDGNFRALGFLQLTFTNEPDYPAITNADIVTVPRGQPFTYVIATGASDPADPVSYSMVGTLPPGLSFNAATGTITGIYSGPLQQNEAASPARSGGDSPNAIQLSGGALLGSIQLFGTNSHGTSTFQLLFLAPPSGAVNISTRALVGTDENVLIGGFIVTGSAPKVVIIRAIGPSLGIPTALQDPILQLVRASDGQIVINDDWKTTQEQIIKDTTIPPTDTRESAIVIALDPGNYTAIVSGKNGGTGIGLVEVYDLGTASIDPATKAQLAQISTRANVLTGDNCMIGGFIVSGVTTKVLVRAIGPSLANSPFNIANALRDTTLELRDSNGALIRFNDDWRSDQQQEIINTTVPPSDDRESAAVASLVPNAYTAIVRGKGDTIGVGLVEVYALQ